MNRHREPEQNPHCGTSCCDARHSTATSQSQRMRTRRTTSSIVFTHADGCGGPATLLVIRHGANVRGANRLRSPGGVFASNPTGEAPWTARSPSPRLEPPDHGRDPPCLVPSYYASVGCSVGACEKPGLELRSRWPAQSRCTSPQAPMDGDGPHEARLKVSFLGGRLHLPIVSLRRTA